MEQKSLVSQNLATSITDDDRPNIIIVVTDDMGREVPTYNGGQSYSTPNLDFIAANGLQFNHFYCHPDGPPSRLAMVTGKYNYRNWVEFGTLPFSEKTFANLVHDNGYSTCFTGKWQFDGGDSSIRSHGFDNYLVFMPFEPEDNNGHDQFYRRYKNPYLYREGMHLTEEEVAGRYSEDMFYDYAANFIDSNLTKPFFLMYSFNLLQKPWSPTPDNPDFAAWDPAVDDDTRDDKLYFPDMVSYMDKIVGKLIDKVQTAGLSNNTIIVFTSDNATVGAIRSTYHDSIVKGGKASTVNAGINVPMLVYAPGFIPVPGSIDTSIVDMTDFFPTVASIAGVSPVPYKPLDGVSFYDNILGVPGKQREYSYCFWPQYTRDRPPVSYVFNYNYKLYDSATGGRFYNIMLDQNEKRFIPDRMLSKDEKKIKAKFLKILEEGKP